MQHLSEQKAKSPLAVLEYWTPLERLLNSSPQDWQDMYMFYDLI